MNRNRLPAMSEPIRLPRPPAPSLAPGSFVLWPPGCLVEWTAAQQLLYRLAFEQAREAAKPSLPERDLAGVWN